MSRLRGLPLDRRVVISGLAATTFGASRPLNGKYAVGRAVKLLGNVCAIAPSTTISWLVDVAHPIFFGVHEVTIADGAPRDMLIYYPAADFRSPPIFQSPLQRWPLVLFLHGYPPTVGGVPLSAGYFRKWWRLPSMLARAGYVVAVPNLDYPPFYRPTTADIDAAVADIAWVRTQWCGAATLDQRPSATAVAGHSDGAMLAGAIASAHPELAALISLSGPYGQNLENLTIPQSVKIPSLHMWLPGTSEDFDYPIAEGKTLWASVAQPKWGVSFVGKHFDYLDAGQTGDVPRGSCDLVAGVASGLAALFLGANVASLTQVRADLTLAPVSRTPLQQTYYGDYFQDIVRAGTDLRCQFLLRWQVDGVAGSRSLRNIRHHRSSFGPTTG